MISIPGLCPGDLILTSCLLRRHEYVRRCVYHVQRGRLKPEIKWCPDLFILYIFRGVREEEEVIHGRESEQI